MTDYYKNKQLALRWLEEKINEVEVQGVELPMPVLRIKFMRMFGMGDRGLNDMLKNYIALGMIEIVDDKLRVLKKSATKKKRGKK